jgi:uncharacterized protein (DUF433 family)
VLSQLGRHDFKTPGTCGGRARIAGTRIKVEHVYNWVERQGMAPAAVVKAYPHLNLAQVHAALAYYWSHEAEIQQDIAEGGKAGLGTESEKRPVKAPGELAERGNDDSLPPQ